MCTAISISGTSKLFGRTLDLEDSYGEGAVMIGRRARLLREARGEHGAIIGTAIVADGIPLFFDAMNEHGLAAAALNFPMSAVYLPRRTGKRNLPSYALISEVLSECKCLADAVELLRSLNITPDSFSEILPATPMHWIFSDGCDAIAAEPLSGGLSVMPSPTGVLTNEPPYESQLLRLSEYADLAPGAPENRLFKGCDPKVYCGGLAAVGLPGDPSSVSRHVRAAYMRAYSRSDGSEWGEISRFFHIADSVAVADGASISPDGKPTRTVYTSLYDITHRTYYVRTYHSHRIFSLPLGAVDPDGDSIAYVGFPSGGHADSLI